MSEDVATGVMETPAVIESFGNFVDSGGGDIADILLANNLDPNALRINRTLQKDEWLELDTAVEKVFVQRLRGVRDLMSRGLSRTISNGLGTTVLENETETDLTPAELHMDATTRGKKDRPIYASTFLPLPIIHKDFSFNIRQLTASRQKGQSLDVSTAEIASRKVAEMAEQILFQGASAYTFAGGTIRGYEDFPSGNSVTLTAAWNASAATGETMLADVLGMKQANINARRFGPYALYIPTSFETAIDADFKSNSDKSIRQRILEVADIDSVQVADFLTAGTVVLVQLDVQTVRMINALPLTTVQWQTEGAMTFHFKVMTILIPQMRADASGRSGVCVGS